MRFEMWFVSLHENETDEHGYFRGMPQIMERTLALNFEMACDIAAQVAANKGWKVVAVKQAGNYKI